MKIKKMADGGTTPGTQQPTYPFYGNQQTQATTTPRVVQNVNIPQPGFPLSQPANTLNQQPTAMKKGGKVKKLAKGGSASSRADGIAQRGKTRGKFV